MTKIETTLAKIVDGLRQMDQYGPSEAGIRRLLEEGEVALSGPAITAEERGSYEAMKSWYD